MIKLSIEQLERNQTKYFLEIVSRFYTNLEMNTKTKMSKYLWVYNCHYLITLTLYYKLKKNLRIHEFPRKLNVNLRNWVNKSIKNVLNSKQKISRNSIIENK